MTSVILKQWCTVCGPCASKCLRTNKTCTNAKVVLKPKQFYRLHKQYMRLALEKKYREYEFMINLYGDDIFCYEDDC